jgi:hypothetical protein
MCGHAPRTGQVPPQDYAQKQPRILPVFDRLRKAVVVASSRFCSFWVKPWGWGHAAKPNTRIDFSRI